VISRPAAEWERLLADVSVPAGRVLTVPAALDQEQVRVRGLVHEVAMETSDGLPAYVLGSGVHVDGAILSPSSPPPLLGEHTGEILAELGYSEHDVTRLRDVGAV
jgi:crotonobetainyl-CoA:carnitine CoA-transferase CaiB-like acyl-CoA transferase